MNWSSFLSPCSFRLSGRAVLPRYPYPILVCLISVLYLSTPDTVFSRLSLLVISVIRLRFLVRCCRFAVHILVAYHVVLLLVPRISSIESLSFRICKDGANMSIRHTMGRAFKAKRFPNLSRQSHPCITVVHKYRYIYTHARIHQ